jgi:hypothetical protein
MRDSRHDRRLELSLGLGGKLTWKVSGRLLVSFAGLLVCWFAGFSGCNQWEAETPAEGSAMIHVPIWDVWQRVSRRMECSISD